MGTDLSESRRERSEERHRGDSPLIKSVDRDDLDEYEKDKVRDHGKHRSKDKKRSRRDDKDHRSRDTDRSKEKDDLKERELDVKDSGKDRISSKVKRKEGTEVHEKDRTKDKGRDRDPDRDKQRAKGHDRERKRVRELERENEPESDRGQEKERGKEKGKEKEREKDKGRDRERGKDRDREKEKEKTRDREKDREQDKDKDKDRYMLDRENDKDYTREKEREGDHGKDRYTDREKLSKRSRDDHDSKRDGAKDAKAKEDSTYSRDDKGKTSPEEVTAHITQGDYVKDPLPAKDHSRKDIEERISKMKEVRLKRKSEGASEILSWVNKSRKLEENINFERQKAKQRSKMFDELDNVDDDDDEGFPNSKGATDALAGVKVLHGFEKVLEGGSVILTLKDQEILAEGDVNENMDMLENVEIGEQKRRNEAYKAGNKISGMYDDKFNDVLGEEKKMLPQYDDPAEEKGVTLDASGRFTANKKIEELRKKLQIPSHNNQVEDLTSAVRVSSDYYTPEEMLQFKKPKKKKSLRKREKLDLDALEAEARAEGLGSSDLRSRNDSKSQTAKEEEERAEAKRRSNAYLAAFAKADEASRALRMDQRLPTVNEEDDADIFEEDAEDLQKSLERARKLALKEKTEKAPTGPEAIARLARSAVGSQSLDAHNSTSGDTSENKVVFTEMEEFVWGLQLEEDTDKPTHEDVFMEEDEAPKASVEKKDESKGWTEVLESGTGEPSKTEVKEEIALDNTIHEVAVGKGLSGALKLLKERGTLKETIEWGGRNMDKKKSKLVGIHEDEGPKEIHLERRDEFGRVLTPKEAFRLISHKFHGKGPGKGKQEKRMKQYQDEQKLKQMTSSDVLPQSVERMREAQLQLKTPYLVLSGNVRPGQTSDPRSGFATVEKEVPGSLTPMLGDAKVEHFLGIKRKPEDGAPGQSKKPRPEDGDPGPSKKPKK
ncbi:hypothetical protein RND81_08G070200 [Saponaria officinalis]|uniref:SART-1 n=1 Tax=Saponaria officinalis TaxID=3572 RepID=A0AAW1J4H1_SAPOF